jgi:endonuclease G
MQLPLSQAAVYSGFPETFESASKGAYAAADVNFGTGTWNLDNALVGTSASDAKSGNQSVRVTGTGVVAMKFNLIAGATQVSVKHAVYGSDGSSTWKLEASTDGGTTWTQVGTTQTSSSASLSSVSFTCSFASAVRFRIVKLSGGTNRINIDDFSVTDNTGTSATPSRDNNLNMGNPSAAQTVTTTPNNYLMSKTQYTLSYNSSKGGPNWVSWHLSTAWKGTATRCDCFTSDAALPTGFYKATTSNYTNTGFDRGHMCPSEDRDGSAADNAATFLMTNILPQAPINNQQTWVALENYCRTLINNGNELYIISGQYGQGGTGSNGSANSIAGGKINVPARVWKVIVVLPTGSNDVSRVTSATRVIAVDMPNTQTVNSQTWGYYRVKVDAIETATGYDFLSAVPTNIQSVIESVVDSGPTQ